MFQGGGDGAMIGCTGGFLAGGVSSAALWKQGLLGAPSGYSGPVVHATMLVVPSALLGAVLFGLLFHVLYSRQRRLDDERYDKRNEPEG